MIIIIASKGLLLVHSTLFLINDKDFIIEGDIASSHTMFTAQLRRPRHPDCDQQVGGGLGLLPRQPQELHRGKHRRAGHRLPGDQCATWPPTRVTLPGDV